MDDREQFLTNVLELSSNIVGICNLIDEKLGEEKGEYLEVDVVFMKKLVQVMRDNNTAMISIFELAETLKDELDKK